MSHLYWQEEGESVDEFHTRLKRNFGCDNCPEYDNNGCGSWLIDDWEFGMGDNGPWCQDIRASGVDSLGCSRQEAIHEDLREMAGVGFLTNNESRIEGAAYEFKRYIEAALESAPEGMPPEIYGELVRSAAAVYCHQRGEKDTSN